MEAQYNKEKDTWHMPPTARFEQRDYVERYVTRLHKLFDSIDTNIKKEIAPRYATEGQIRELHITLDQCKDFVLSQILKLVEDYEGYGYTLPILIADQTLKADQTIKGSRKQQ